MSEEEDAGDPGEAGGGGASFSLLRSADSGRKSSSSYESVEELDCRLGLDVREGCTCVELFPSLNEDGAFRKKEQNI